MKLRYPAALTVIIVALVMSVPLFASSREDYSTYNSDWNGCSQLKDLTASDTLGTAHTTRVISSMEKELRGNGVLVLFLGDKSTALTNDEIASIKAFVQNGGKLFLASDFGNANPILDGLGLGTLVRFNGSLLRDDFSNWRENEYPVVFRFANSTVTQGVGTVDFNFATALDISENATAGNVTALAMSSNASYFNNTLTHSAKAVSNAEQGERPVVAYVGYGHGSIIICSDPSAFINDMLGRGGNAKLYKNIITTLASGNVSAPVIFDESHSSMQPFWVVLYNSVNANDVTRYMFALSLIGALATGITVSTYARNKRHIAGVHVDELCTDVALNEDAVIDDIIARHPGWSKAKAKELLRNEQLRNIKR